MSQKATRIDLFSFSSPHMRAFHMTWMAFFFCFFALPVCFVHLPAEEETEIEVSERILAPDLLANEGGVRA